MNDHHVAMPEFDREEAQNRVDGCKFDDDVASFMKEQELMHFGSHDLDQKGARTQPALEPNTALLLTRPIVVGLIGETSRVAKLKIDSVQVAVALFDSVMSRGNIVLEDVPSIAASITKIVLKSSRSLTFCFRHAQLASFQEASSALGRLLHSQGFVASPIPKERLNLDEGRVLKELSWRTDVPSVDLWMEAITERFCAAAKASLAWQAFFLHLRYKGCEMMSHMLMHKSFFEFSIHSIAAGLAVLGFKAAGMIPDVLQPRTLAWLTPAAAHQPPVDAGVSSVWELLEIACAASQEELQADAKDLEHILGELLN